jgi:hypothetical protein
MIIEEILRGKCTKANNQRQLIEINDDEPTNLSQTMLIGQTMIPGLKVGDQVEIVITERRWFARKLSFAAKLMAARDAAHAAEMKRIYDGMYSDEG